jgi:plastocyanin
MRTRTAFLAPLLVLALAAAGCGSSNDKSSSNTSSTKSTSSQPKSASGGASAGGGKVTAVSLKNIQFNPKSITVAAGGTVKWTNDDSVSHDVTKTGGPGPKFSSGTGNLANGATYKHVFAKAGTYQIVCTVHPGMTQTVTVK